MKTIFKNPIRWAMYVTDKTYQQQIIDHAKVYAGTKRKFIRYF